MLNPTGWVKYGQRWYNAGTGRWTQMDTLDAPLDPANANRYAYAANDPINNADPLGLWIGDLAGEVIGTAVGGAFGFLVAGAAAGFTAGIGAPIAGGVAAGCVKAAVSEGVSNAFDGESTSLGDMGAQCAYGAFSGGVSSLVRKPGGPV